MQEETVRKKLSPKVNALAQNFSFSAQEIGFSVQKEPVFKIVKLLLVLSKFLIC